MKHKVICWDKKEGESVFEQICDSKKAAQDLIDCENDLAADNGEDSSFYNWETEKREHRFEWYIVPIEKKLTPVSFGPDGKDRHYLPL